MKKKVNSTVLSQEELASDIYSLWIESELAADVKPGQFVGVYPSDKSTLLPRPISICEVNDERTALRLVYRTAGKGTREFSHLKKGRNVQLLGVLGNGFPVDECEGKDVILIAGGIGVPPMLQLAKELSGFAGEGVRKAKSVTVVLGYRNADVFLKEEFEQYAGVVIATEDGSIGTKGNVGDAIREGKITGDIIMSCGPMPMLRAVKSIAAEMGAKAYISLEERMACGVGACLGCVCKTTHKDAHSLVNNARICTDGPVFDAEEVDI
ncbi:MAG: dihydroorotate dehydrogenase electron transfer subunit [Lachnospiraceae bacterium]|nr:dihydroorotate dehydrogenase electron transfer subunit [Lachnospiraceae bacterium]